MRSVEILLTSLVDQKAAASARRHPLAKFGSLFAGLVIAALASSSPVHADALTDQYGVLRKYFSQQQLIPVLFPRGQEIGDVYDSSDLRLLARRSDCFPKLKLPTAQKTTLPTLVMNAEADVSMVLGVSTVGSASGQLQRVRSATIEYQDAEVVSASALAMIQQFSKDACQFLAPQVTLATTSGRSEARPLLVVGEVVLAKRKIELIYSNDAAAKAELSKISEWIQKLGLKASVSAASKDTSRLVVASNDSLPIAVRPAFVPNLFANGHLGGDDKDAKPPQVSWTPIQSPPTKMQAHEIDDFSRLLEKSIGNPNAGF